MTIAKRANTDNRWMAWIPLLNIVLILRIAKLPWWYVFGLLLIILPFIGPLAVLALYVWWFWIMCEQLQKPGWWGILLVVPFVNLIMLGILAWAE
ncbi:MAG: hypothetical protein HC945_00510 [Nitrosarchaeum sp.]|nr:hypothetical protein [Nitrosarchaeum sp.]